MPNTKIEQDSLWSHHEVEKLKEEVAVLVTQIIELEQKNLRSPVFLQKPGRYFGFGAAGKLDWARFKLDFKQEELDRFETRPEMLKATANPSDPADDSRSATPEPNIPMTN
jgi:hypothetical protein